jgi:hypothetical protein
MSTDNMSAGNTGAEEKPEGLGSDGTIPNTENGIAIGHDPEGSTFEPEEDAAADDAIDDALTNGLDDGLDDVSDDDEKPTGI